MCKVKKKIDVFRAADLPKLYRDIFESYHNESDLLSELLQNAIDSIRIAKSDAPLVEIRFNVKDKVLSVKDNGLGMTVEDLEDFALGRTKKDAPQFSSLGGEKGLGSSYIFGGSDKFYIETCKDGNFTIAECIDAHNSIMKNKEPEFFVLEEETQDRVANFTEIQITGDLFYLDFNDRDEIEYLIRTFTAVGYTLPLIGRGSLDVKVKLTWVDENEEESSKYIDNKFRHPVIDHEEKIMDYSEASNIDYGFGSFLKLADKENNAIGIFGESNLFKEFNLSTGIFLSVKGYPTVVDISPPKTGLAGYWARSILILVNDDNVSLDAGRKSINTKDKNRIRGVAKDIFNKLVKYHKKFIKQTESEAEKAILDNLIEESKNLDELKIKGIAYRKKPDFEQGVVAIFHELLGAGKLRGYYPLLASTDTRYDEIIYYEIPIEELGSNYKQKFLEGRRNIKNKKKKYMQNIIVEFKLKANEIMRDLKKDLRMIDLLIAYDYDKSKLTPHWSLIKLDEKDIVFKGANYKMINPTNDFCYVMLLKDFEQD